MIALSPCLAMDLQPAYAERTMPRSNAARVRREPLPQRWCQRLFLDDGRELLLRPIEPADAAPLRAGFALLTPEEVRLRFLHPLKELTPEMSRRLTQLDPRREFALVAAEPLPAGEALVGAVARAAIEDDGRAEFAILVSRFLAHQGLGALMLKQMIRWARLKKVPELYGDVLDENTAMLGLAKSLGFSREVLADEPGLLRVRLPLRPV
jgi:RimJ/RimL family protein N-acetyltransferase